MKIIRFIVFSILLLMIPAYASAQNQRTTANVANFDIELNGQVQKIENSIIAINNRTYLPIREIAELLDLYVVWDEDAKTIKISDIGTISENANEPVMFNSTTVMADVTDFKLKVEGIERIPENSIVVIDGTSYLPLREISEMLNIEVKWDGKTQTIYIDSSNNELVEYDFLLPFSDNNSNLWGYMDMDGNVVVEPKYTYAGDFVEGMALVSDKEESAYDDWERTGQYGYINIKGEEVVPCEYYGFNNFSDGLAAVAEKVNIAYQGDTEYTAYKYSYINKDGDVIIEGDFYDAGNFGNGYAPVMILKDDEPRYIYIDMNGEEMSNFNNQKIDAFKNGYAVANDKLIDTDFEVVMDYKKLGYELVSEVVNGMVVARKNSGSCGIIDLYGNVVVPFEYYYLQLNEKNPIFAIKDIMNESGKKEECCGYIDLNNNIILPFKYYMADGFAGGVSFVVNSKDDCGNAEELFNTILNIDIIDKTGRVIKEDIDAGFWLEYTGNSYPNGIRKYYRGDKLIYINSRGVFINPKI